jgi:hypothetical protein
MLVVVMRAPPVGTHTTSPAPRASHRVAAAALLHSQTTHSQTGSARHADDHALVPGRPIRPHSASSALALDPPCTPVRGELEALQQGPVDRIVYCCSGCGSPAFSAEKLAGAPLSTSKKSEGAPIVHGALHVTGWPTFDDFLGDAVTLRSAFTADAARRLRDDDDVQHPAPDNGSGPVSTVKTSLTLRDVASVNMDVNIVSRGDTFEDRASMRSDISKFPKSKLRQPKTLKKRRQGQIFSRYRSAGAKKLLEERRKVIQTHLQGHCKKCDKALCIASSRKGQVRLVANPSALHAIST